MSQELTKFESIAQLIAKNDPIIDEKISKAIAACKLIQIIETDEQDTIANNTLVKCNATFPIIQGLRKEYTSPLDDWKARKMIGEKELQKEMDRLKALRNERASRKATSDREDKAKIEAAKNKAIEVSRIKNEQVLAVQLGIANRMTQGEIAIAKIFNGLTIENFEIESKKLNFTPKLKEEIFRGFIAVDYNPDLVPYEEFKAICDAAYAHFDYDKCDKEYCAAVNEVLKTWRAKLPAKKAELEKIALGGAEAARLKQFAQDKADYEAAERLKEAETVRFGLESKAKEQQQNEALDAEFTGQIALQDITMQDGVRGVVSYRLAKEDSPIKIVEAMSRVILQVLADPAFKGIHKRDKAGIPKRNEKGEAEYIDAIQSWLDLLAKVKPAPEFEGVIKIEDVKTVAKAK